MTIKSWITNYRTTKHGKDRDILWNITTSIGEAESERLIKGRKPVRVIGYNPAVGAVLEDITELGVNVTPVNDALAALEAVSTSVADVSGSTGAWTIEVHGLDLAFNEIEEQIFLNGTTPVPLAKIFSRFNVIETIEVGTGGVAAGDITIQTVGGATVFTKLSAGGNKGLNGFYTIPANKLGFVRSWTPSILTSSKNTLARAFLRATADTEERRLLPGIFLFQDVYSSQVSALYKPFINPIVLPPRCDVKVSAQTTAGVADVECSASIDILLVDL